jgi:pimeloyl-ACP methyl ester carboxylesterase
MKNTIAVIILFLSLSSIFVSAQSTKSFSVKIIGEGKPMILIPGLYCKGDVWNETVERYKTTYQCYILTLAGFAGEPAFRNDSILYTVKNEIASYIKENKLEKPVIVGHSLGAFVALWLASSYPDIVGKIICVDGMPFLPAMQIPGATPESTNAMALNIKRLMSNPDTNSVIAYQKMYLPNMISDTNRINTVLDWAKASDQPTMGEVMYEMYSIDLRKEIKNIKTPVLELGTWIAYKDYGATHESVTASLQSQFKELPTAKIVVSDTSRHFIMYDDPQWLYKQMDDFLIAKN